MIVLGGLRGLGFLGIKQKGVRFTKKTSLQHENQSYYKRSLKRTSNKDSVKNQRSGSEEIK